MGQNFEIKNGQKIEILKSRNYRFLLDMKMECERRGRVAKFGLFDSCNGIWMLTIARVF